MTDRRTTGPVVAVVGGIDRRITRSRILLRLLEREGLFRSMPRQVWTSDRSDLGVLAMLRTAVVLASSAVRAGWAAARAHADVIVVGYPGHVDMLVVGPIARIRRIPIVFDPFIAMEDTIVSDRGLRSSSSMTARLARLVDRRAARAATVVLVGTEEEADHLVEITGIDRARVEVLPVGALDMFRRPHSNPVPGRILFYGSYIPLHGIETIVEAARELADAPAMFRLIGTGQERERLEARARETANIELVDPVALEELRDEIATAEICLGIFGTSEKARRVVPHKVYECMAMGKAVVTGDGPAVRSMVGDAVRRVPFGDSAALATELRSLLRDPEQRRELGDAARRTFDAAFSEAVLARRLHAVIDSVSTGR